MSRNIYKNQTNTTDHNQAYPSPSMSRYKSPFEVVQTTIMNGDDSTEESNDFTQLPEDPELSARKFQIRRYFMINSHIRRNLSCSKSMECKSTSFEHERIKSNIHSDMAGVLCVNGRKKPFIVRFSLDGKSYIPGMDD